jgi:hypothetical protein
LHPICIISCYSPQRVELIRYRPSVSRAAIARDMRTTKLIRAKLPSRLESTAEHIGLALLAFGPSRYGRNLTWVLGSGDMEDDLSKAQHYRDQATHMRELAAKDQNVETRDALISLAQNYDRLCLKYLVAAGKPSSDSP